MKTQTAIQQENILERKIWYRAIKTIYIVVYIFVVITILFFGYSLKPYSAVDSLSSIIMCNNGRRLAPSNNATIFEDGTLGIDDSFTAERLCSDQKDFVPDAINYTVQVSHKTSGTWATPLLFWVIGFFIAFLLFEVIKRTFLYIVIGKRFIRDYW